MSEYREGHRRERLRVRALHVSLRLTPPRRSSVRLVCQRRGSEVRRGRHTRRRGVSGVRCDRDGCNGCAGRVCAVGGCVWRARARPAPLSAALRWRPGRAPSGPACGRPASGPRGGKKKPCELRVSGRGTERKNVSRVWGERGGGSLSGSQPPLRLRRVNTCLLLTTCARSAHSQPTRQVHHSRALDSVTRGSHGASRGGLSRHGAGLGACLSGGGLLRDIGRRRRGSPEVVLFH